jgi:hypothetical protein
MTAGKNDKQPSRDEIYRRVIGRWENEGGAATHWEHEAQSVSDPTTVVGEIGDAQEVNIRVRLIAIENIIVALLANAPGDRLELIKEMAEFISPRPGMTPHRLTIEAARNMLAIVERAEQYRRSAGPSSSSDLEGGDAVS